MQNQLMKSKRQILQRLKTMLLIWTYTSVPVQCALNPEQGNPGCDRVTKEEFGKLSCVIKTIYPSEIPNKQAVELWFAAIANIPYETANAAFADWITHNHFAPKPSDFIDFAANSTSEVLIDEHYCAKVQRYINAVERKELSEPETETGSI